MKYPTLKAFLALRAGPVIAASDRTGVPFAFLAIERMRRLGGDDSLIVHAAVADAVRDSVGTEPKNGLTPGRNRG